MMTDLFSSLDCNQIGPISILLWVTPMILAISFFTFSWKTQNLKLVAGMISTNGETRANNLLPLPLFLFSLMTFLISMNLTGLIPFVYGATSSLWLAGSLALTMWGLLILSGWSFNLSESVAHLAPAGAPAALTPFLVLIETVSILIRPLTLTVRLIANISAGHIVMSLIANCLVGASFLPFIPLLALNVGYYMFEVFVCVIQAYIFTLLIKLYAEEHPAAH